MSGAREAAEARYLALLSAHGAALARTASAYERDPSRRADLVQEIALALWQALPRFRGEASEKTFVLRIAHNRGISHSVRRKTLPGPLPEEFDPPDRAPGPEAQAARNEQREQLVAALARLPLAPRQLLALALEGLSHREIAEVLGIRENAAAVRLTRARQALRDELGRTEARREERRG